VLVLGAIRPHSPLPGSHHCLLPPKSLKKKEKQPSPRGAPLLFTFSIWKRAWLSLLSVYWLYSSPIRDGRSSRFPRDSAF
jgi:hypothetical protein